MFTAICGPEMGVLVYHRSKLAQICLMAILAIFATSAHAAEGPGRDRVIQPPQLNAPDRGSLAGTLASKQWGPGDVSRGGFSLPFPAQLPEGRGPLLVSVLPNYSPEGGLSEWGMGWGSALSLARFRLTGDLQYDATDLLTSPWGRLERGDDGAWYPADLRVYARVEPVKDGWVATTQDGTRVTFGSSVIIGGPRGTFAWYITQAEDRAGHQTHLRYEVDGGRPYLSEVTYGRAGWATQRVRLEYEPVAHATTRWDAGAPITLGQRVSKLSVEVLDAATRTWAPRFAYGLAYEEDAAGAAFFLHQVTKVYASGESEPPITFQHTLWTTELEAAEARPNAKLQSYFDLAGHHAWAGSLDPRHATFFDADGDGRTDVETSYDYSLLKQTASGWDKETLPPRADEHHALCRAPTGAFNLARNLARMVPGDANTYVFNAAPRNGIQTHLTICDRPGHLLYDAVVDGTWRLGPQTRLVDVNRDHAPDLVSMGRGHYRVLPNESSRGSFGFGTARTRTLSPPVQPEVSWVQDINGDGVPDLLVLMPTGLLAWHGVGNFEFTEQGTLYKLHGLMGPFVLRPSDEIYFVDANRDGLADLVVLVEGRRPVLFVNNGNTLHQVSVPALESLRAQGLGAITFGDFTGGGDTELAMSLQGRAHALALSTPQTSLLAAVDDGKGTQWRLTYARAPAQPGFRHRPALLAAVDAVSSGKDPVRTEFGHAQPVVHTQSEQLIGFGSITMHRGPRRDQSTFYHDDNISGLPLRTISFDTRMPQLQMENTQQYEIDIFRGLAFQRQTSTAEVLHDTVHGTSMRRAETAAAWANPWCATRKVRTSARGTWEQETTLASVADLSDLPHCLVGHEVQRGRHPDSELDFTYEVHVSRDAMGNATQVSLPGKPDLVLQKIEYDSEQRVIASEVPGAGTTRLSYDSTTGLLTTVTAPNGVQTRAEQRNALSDALTALVVDCGSGRHYRQGFAFDGYERLSSRWDNVTGGSATDPIETLTYRYGSGHRPGLVHSRLHLAKRGALEKVAASTGDGALLTEAVRQPTGWQLSGRTHSDPDQLVSTTYRGELLDGAPDADSIFGSYEAIYDNALALSTTRMDALGHVQGGEYWVQSKVRASDTHAYAVRDDALHIHSRDAQGRSTRSTLDIDRRPVSTFDGEQETRFLFDAVGRLRSVTLADGTKHAVSYDSQGRVSAVTRDGLATIAYRYHPGTELLSAVEVSNQDGQAARSVRYVYDGAGRRTEAVFAAQDGQHEVIKFYYDGHNPDGTHVAGQIGFLTGVEGPGFAKTFDYNPDGSLHRKRVALATWRTIEKTFTYFRDGSLESTNTKVLAPSQEVSRLDLKSELDAWGRLHRVLANGLPLYTLSYDKHGDVIAVLAAGDLDVSMARDAITRQVNGVAASAPGWPTDVSLSWERDAVNHIVEESLALGGSTHTRNYAYDARSFLKAWQDHEARKTYTYDKNGLQTVASTKDVILDKEGRVAKHGGREFFYNAAGQLAAVQSARRLIEYTYDEDGQRLFKSINGVPVEAYLDGDVFSEDAYKHPVQAHGWRIGVLTNGQFLPSFADARGTALLNDAAEPVWPTPFGAPALGEALIFANHRFDPDSGTFRMGARDYEPTLGRFTTPDPLFLFQPARCAADPLQCNLFVFGLNDPLQYADPSGLAAEDLWGHCSVGGDYQTVYSHRGHAQGRSESPHNWLLRMHEQGGVQISLVQPDVLFAGGAFSVKLTTAIARTAHQAFTKRMFTAGMTEEALAGMIGQHIRVHDFEGIRAASEYLVEQGVKRAKRVEILQSFVAETVKFELADATTSGVRFWGGKAAVDSQYYLTTFGQLTNRANMSLPIYWNAMSKVVSRSVAEGTPIIRGVAAPQLSHSGIFVGGAEQFFVLYSRTPGVLF